MSSTSKNFNKSVCVKGYHVTPGFIEDGVAVRPDQLVASMDVSLNGPMFTNAPYSRLLTDWLYALCMEAMGLDSTEPVGMDMLPPGAVYAVTSTNEKGDELSDDSHVSS